MSTRNLLVLLFVLPLLAACGKEPVPLVTSDTPFDAPDDAPFWPRFHGPEGNNISTDTGLLGQWPEAGPKLLWTVEGIGEGFASVTTAGGLIYTAGNLGDRTVVSAIYLDGRIRWQQPNGEAWTGSHEGTRGTPTIDGDRVYHENPLGRIVCLGAENGEPIWDRNILDEFDGENTGWALAESLLVDGDRVICCPGGTKASVAALDKMTGKTIWTTPSTGEKTSYASATLAEYQGLRMILTMNAKALIGVSADTGDLLFQYRHITEYDVNALKPIFHDGHVFISSGYGSGSVLLKLGVAGEKAAGEKAAGKKVAVEKVWESKQLDNHHGGVILLDGYLYGACHNRNNAKWVCLDWKTGDLEYAERGVGKGSVTCAEGMLYTLSEKEKVGLAEATPTGHDLVSQFRIPSGGEGPSWAHPVVCGGRLYVRHGDRLFAYDVRIE